MDGTTRVVLILIILVGLGFASARARSRETDKIQVLLDDATKQAVDKGEFKFSDEIVPIESKDCEGTQWIKQQGCSLNGASMDGTEGSCGPGKEIWILDPAHPNFKPATGDGKCKPQERDCEVKCPKPCEGDTWKDSGKCVRKEYDTKGNVTETVLDGTEGKCGEGVRELRLDTTASDYKPAVGKGTCPMTKGGYCNVPCPKPEPPKCNSYTGWVENVGLGCVRSETDNRKVKCGEKGVKQFYNVATNSEHCQDLVEWRECSGDPCPINCEGSWSKWSEPKSDEPCGVQPYREMTFSITTKAQFGGYACDYPDGDKQTRNAGTPKECCIENNDWALKPGTCGADGVGIYTQTYKENKVGGCPDEVKSKKMACCYKKGDWTDTTKCNAVGRKSQKQTTAGNCPSSVKTRKVDCKYIGEWSKVGGCSVLGKQTYIRNVVNGTETTQKIEDCCFKTDWVNSGACKSNGKQTQTRTVKNCPGESATREVDCKYIGEWSKSGGCSDQGKQTYTRTVVNGTETTQKTENCCYKTNWTNSGECSTEGKQRQTRTVKNCPGETATRDVDCCYKTNWTNSGGCSTEGRQRQTRTVKNCPGETNTRDINCCYKTNWTNSGGCSTSGRQKQTRTVRNCPGETNTKYINCCYATGWTNSGGCSTSGQQKQTRTIKNCPGQSSTRHVNCPVDCKGYWNEAKCPTSCPTPKQTVTSYWNTTQSPLHGGKACPSPSTRTKTCPAKKCKDDYEGGGGQPRNYYSEWTSYGSDRYRGTLLAYCNEQSGCFNEYSDAPGFKRDRAPWLYRWRGKKVHDSDDKCIPRWKFKNELNDYADKCAKMCNKHDKCKMFAINNCTCRLYSDANEYTWGKKDNASTASCYVPDWWHPPLWRKKSEGVNWRKKCTNGGKWHPSPGPFSV